MHQCAAFLNMNLPIIYPIVDATTLARARMPISTFAKDLRSAGVRFLQYRDKDSSDADFLEQAIELRAIFPAATSTLILNDRAHLLTASGFDGLHIGQEDLTAEEARAIIGAEKHLGLSTHNPAQLQSAAVAPVDYLAVGPIFSTQSKLNPDPVIGVEGICMARSLARKPLVAIGGITPENVRSVFDAGADSVALISALLPMPGRSLAKVMEDFLTRIG